VQGPCYYGDTWNAARGSGRVHLGVDIAAAEGSPLFAVVTGKVIQIYTDRPGSLSGNGIKIARPDGTYFFYAHMSALAPGMAVGTPVTAGQVIGYVGRTGNAGGPHLHLEVHPLGGAAINPYPIVKAHGAC
jgi:murein DD-endopeptidase MepM/ murein hydrolase activator NlpD